MVNLFFWRSERKFTSIVPPRIEIWNSCELFLFAFKCFPATTVHLVSFMAKYHLNLFNHEHIILFYMSTLFILDKLLSVFQTDWQITIICFVFWIIFHLSIFHALSSSSSICNSAKHEKRLCFPADIKWPLR